MCPLQKKDSDRVMCMAMYKCVPQFFFVLFFSLGTWYSVGGNENSTRNAQCCPALQTQQSLVGTAFQKLAEHLRIQACARMPNITLWTTTSAWNDGTLKASCAYIMARPLRDKKHQVRWISVGAFQECRLNGSGVEETPAALTSLCVAKELSKR